MADRVTLELGFVEVSTPLGRLTVLGSDLGVVATIGEEERSTGGLEHWEHRLGLSAKRATRRLGSVRQELEGYFLGRVHRFTIPVDLRSVGEGFSRRVLETVRRIPYGEMRTYGDVADEAGSPRAGRAAGSALARCPVEILVPCHRVVGAGAGLGGYGGHDERKAYLLRLEAAI